MGSTDGGIAMPLMSDGGGSHRRTSSAAVVAPDMTGSVRCRGVEGQMSMTADGFLEYHPTEVRKSVTIEVFATVQVQLKTGACHQKISMPRHIHVWVWRRVENSWPSGNVEVYVDNNCIRGVTPGVACLLGRRALMCAKFFISTELRL
jgi:hypothetical protein